MGPQSPPDQLLRKKRPEKRSLAACVLCHKRKVRCDALAREGRGCTNCYLDGQECVVNRKRIKGGPQPSTINTQRASPTSVEETLSKSSFFTFFENVSTSSGNTEATNSCDLPTGHQNDFAREDISIASSCPDNKAHDDKGQDISYLSYGFLQLNNLEKLSLADTQYLQSKGCLHVPHVDLVEELVRQYFLHVHPSLPVLDEGRFWQIYRGYGVRSSSLPKISLFLFQTMLFAGAPFVLPGLLHQAGFRDVRSARDLLYNRAKTIYDLGAETDPLVKSQGAVILSCQTSSEDPLSASQFLACAIQNAVAVGAHCCNSDLTDPLRTVKNRLWWSILLRDRLLSLGLRRYPQISLATFQLTDDCLDEADMTDEIVQSEVYNRDTKSALLRIWKAQCQLSVALTELVMAICSSGGLSFPVCARSIDDETIALRIKAIKNRLNGWYLLNQQALEISGSLKVDMKAVALFKDLTFMYYHAARLALCDYQTLIIENRRARSLELLRQDLMLVKDEFEQATISMTGVVQRFVINGFAPCLPMTVTAFTALPLILQALDLQFSPTQTERDTSAHQLRFFLVIMQQSQYRYNASNVLAQLIQKLLYFARTQGTAICRCYRPVTLETQPHKRNHLVPGVKTDMREQVDVSLRPDHRWNWWDLFVSYPRFYLQLSITLHNAFSSGRVPDYRNISMPLCGLSNSNMQAGSLQGSNPTAERHGTQFPATCGTGLIEDTFVSNIASNPLQLTSFTHGHEESPLSRHNDSIYQDSFLTWPWRTPVGSTMDCEDVYDDQLGHLRDYTMDPTWRSFVSKTQRNRNPDQSEGLVEGNTQVEVGPDIFDAFINYGID